MFVGRFKSFVNRYVNLSVLLYMSREQRKTQKINEHPLSLQYRFRKYSRIWSVVGIVSLRPLKTRVHPLLDFNLYYESTKVNKFVFPPSRVNLKPDIF